MNRNFIRYSVVLLLAVGALAVPGTAAEEALRLRFSFDDTLVAEVGHIEAQGDKVSFEPSRFGKAVQVAQGGRLGADLSNALLPAKGTLSFWCRPSVDLAPPTALGRIVHIQSQEEGFSTGQ